MGKALYRKYRSKTLDEVVGQKHITDTLKNALKKGTISHAYLFTGPRGVGKTSIARILAHEINDLPYSDESTHLDIVEIDAASNRRIDEIRELRDKVHIAPSSAKYKVYIIDEVHMLTREAFNALLKTLEEPPAHVVFILATTEAHKVPDTILSRTQRFTFRPVGGEDALAHLRSIADKESIRIDNEALELLVEHGQGSFRDSISMLDQLSGMNKESYSADDVRELLGVPSHALILDLIQTIEKNDRNKLFENIQALKVQGIDAGRTTKAVSTELREHILSGNVPLGYERTLALLEKLVQESVHNDYLRLELSLLRVMETPRKILKTPTVPDSAYQPTTNNDADKITSQNSEAKTEKVKSEKNRIDDNTQESDNKKPDTSTKESFNQDAWKEMLDKIKAKHNTLYGVMRMAQPVQTDSGLELLFSFDFHKKQLETDKNKPIVREYLNTYLGTTEFSAVVKKAANKSVDKLAEKVVEKQKVAHIDNVSNIFGSAELLD